MAKKKTETEGNASKRPTIDEFEWDMMREVIGEALEFRTSIRIKLATKLDQKVLEGIPEAKGDILYITNQNQRVKVPLERMVAVEAL